MSTYDTDIPASIEDGPTPETLAERLAEDSRVHGTYVLDDVVVFQVDRRHFNRGEFGGLLAQATRVHPDDEQFSQQCEEVEAVVFHVSPPNHIRVEFAD